MKEFKKKDMLYDETRGIPKDSEKFAKRPIIPKTITSKEKRELKEKHNLWQAKFPEQIDNILNPIETIFEINDSPLTAQIKDDNHVSPPISNRTRSASGVTTMVRESDNSSVADNKIELGTDNYNKATNKLKKRVKQTKTKVKTPKVKKVLKDSKHKSRKIQSKSTGKQKNKKINESINSSLTTTDDDKHKNCKPTKISKGLSSVKKALFNDEEVYQIDISSFFFDIFICIIIYIQFILYTI
jgi:hypothetical protein